MCQTGRACMGAQYPASTTCVCSWPRAWYKILGLDDGSLRHGEDRSYLPVSCPMDAVTLLCIMCISPQMLLPHSAVPHCVLSSCTAHCARMVKRLPVSMYVAIMCKADTVLDLQHTGCLNCPHNTRASRGYRRDLPEVTTSPS
jgi:hypothetical protein